jgi:ADP-heptose:LPS heptosyltransferase
MKTQKKLRDFILSALPGGWARRISTTLVQRHCSHTILSFPPSCADFKSLLIILPQNPRQALLQTAHLQALLTSFDHSTITLLCTHDVADFLKHFSNSTTIIAYDPDTFKIFSSQHAAVAHSLHQQSFDLCIMLEQEPVAALEHLCGMSAAPYRIGYSDGASYPFTNCHIRPSASPAYLPEQYGAIARMLGSSVKKGARCAVSKEIMTEVQMLLRELGLSATAQAPLYGIDAPYFYQNFTPQWTAMLLQALAQGSGARFYAFNEGSEGIGDWLHGQGVSVLPPQSASRQAALLLSSSSFIAGNSATFQLAAIFNAPCIGLFEQGELGAFCKPQKAIHALTYCQAPDSATIDAVVKQLTAAVAEA